MEGLNEVLQYNGLWMIRQSRDCLCFKKNKHGLKVYYFSGN